MAYVKSKKPAMRAPSPMPEPMPETVAEAEALEPPAPPEGPPGGPPEPVTPAEIQAEINKIDPTTHIVRSGIGQGPKEQHYVVGGQAPYSGKSKWCITIANQPAAQQAADILRELEK